MFDSEVLPFFAMKNYDQNINLNNLIERNRKKFLVVFVYLKFITIWIKIVF